MNSLQYIYLHIQKQKKLFLHQNLLVYMNGFFSILKLDNFMHDKNMNGIEHPPKCKLNPVMFKNLLRCAWSADGSKITAGSGDRYLYIWDTTSRRILYKLPGHAGSVNDVAFHPTEPIGKSRAQEGGGGSTMLNMHTVLVHLITFLLLHNHQYWANFYQTWHKAYFGRRDFSLAI